MMDITLNSYTDINIQFQSACRELDLLYLGSILHGDKLINTQVIENEALNMINRPKSLKCLELILRRCKSLDYLKDNNVLEKVIRNIVISNNSLFFDYLVEKMGHE